MKFKNEQLSGIGRQLADGTNCNFPRRGDQPEPTGGRQILMTGHFFLSKKFRLAARALGGERENPNSVNTLFNFAAEKKKSVGGS